MQHEQAITGQTQTDHKVGISLLPAPTGKAEVSA